MNSLKSIWEEQAETAETYVKTPLGIIPKLRCFAATIIVTGHRVFILQLDAEDRPAFQDKLTFRGLTIGVFDFGSSRELQIMLTDNLLEDIFTAFIENIIDDIKDCSTNQQALPLISTVVFRWKRLFDRISSTALSPEAQKGLFGELMLMEELLRHGRTPLTVINAWTGPAFADQDYDFGDRKAEIKLTSSKNPSVRISSERQLTVPDGTTLYLVFYIVNEVKANGTSLTDLIQRIADRLAPDDQLLALFTAKLNNGGYFSADDEHYSRQYMLVQQRIYEITEEFPKLTATSLIQGIYNVSYTIELSACEPYRITDRTAGTLIYGH